MDKKNAKQILLKYQAGTATKEEKVFLENWILYGTSGGIDLTDDELLQDLFEIRKRLNIDRAQNRTVRLWPVIAAAASILLFLSIGGYIILHKQPKQQTARLLNDIAPGGNKAVLTLSGGKQISLTDAKLGVLANEDETIINKTDSGKVIYSDNGKAIATAIAYNTITIPRGGKWNIVLPDGSKAWLDASSSLRFPVAFTGNNRTVEITGQVYFEIVHNAAKPFRVMANGQTVEDIGTHFNINAYTDEPAIKTTLLEGSIKVSVPRSRSSKNRAGIVLMPGQQAVLSPSTNNLYVENANPDNVLAWKEGYFIFKKASIESVMRQFARWYNVDVEYEGTPPASMITGKIHRDVKASEALKILSLLDIHFKIEDKKIIIKS
jgi:transmembrane sensor